MATKQAAKQQPSKAKTPTDSSRALAAGVAALKRSKNPLTRKQIDEKTSKALGNLKHSTIGAGKMVAWAARQDPPEFNGVRIERPERGRYLAVKA
jgi:hypothetical protein